MANFTASHAISNGANVVPLQETCMRDPLRHRRPRRKGKRIIVTHFMLPVKRQKLQFSSHTMPNVSNAIELNYVPDDLTESIEEEEDDHYFRDVFEHFKYDPLLRERELESRKTIEEMFPDLKQPLIEDQDDHPEGVEDKAPLSKKKARRLNRIPLATLKALFKRPEIVEVCFPCCILISLCV